jgi:hypothetical protein
MREGWSRGVVEGNSAWVIVGGVALLGYLADRAMRRTPVTVFRGILAPGDEIQITNESSL